MPYSRKEIEKKVKDIFIKLRNAPDDYDIKGSSSIYYDLGVDSLEIVELMMFFEDEMEIEIPDGEWIDWKQLTVDELIDRLLKEVNIRK